jgi:hypothetical protein
MNDSPPISLNSTSPSLDRNRYSNIAWWWVTDMHSSAGSDSEREGAMLVCWQRYAYAAKSKAHVSEVSRCCAVPLSDDLIMVYHVLWTGCRMG